MLAGEVMTLVMFARAAASLSAVVLAACDPGYTIVGDVVIADSASLGKPLVVQVFEEGRVDPDGLPVPLDGRTVRVALAAIADASTSTFTWGNIGCTEATFVLAWVDVDGSSQLGALLGTRSFTDVDEHNLPHDDPDLATLRTARPAPGDQVAVSSQLRFAHAGSSCDPGSAEITLRLAAFL